MITALILPLRVYIPQDAAASPENAVSPDSCMDAAYFLIELVDVSGKLDFVYFVQPSNVSLVLSAYASNYQVQVGSFFSCTATVQSIRDPAMPSDLNKEKAMKRGATVVAGLAAGIAVIGGIKSLMDKEKEREKDRSSSRRSSSRPSL